MAVLMTVVAPRLLVPQTSLRLCPGAALVAWQSGTRLRALRRRHRDQVDLLSRTSADPARAILTVSHEALPRDLSGACPVAVSGRTGR
ncbi:MAG TPA: hypothetical protein VJ976_03725 [Ornithinimicrobium sp.]|uniref:hypothetical protein n=1 Tax=Ornithinimicrobium sp. TaxID=1977084 RepID=UPI002B49CB47|nr:hypothetical protein [Ornithinimicrobium sp.]HKJ11481.1 hypothetical protein [Ornithinimicrobium sp.]